MSSNPALPEGWREYLTKEGKPYFHNKSTGKTVWKRPGSAASKPVERESPTKATPNKTAKTKGGDMSPISPAGQHRGSVLDRANMFAEAESKAKEKAADPSGGGSDKSRVVLHKEQTALMRKIFDGLDINKNFSVSREEFTQCLDEASSGLHQWLSVLFMISHRETDMGTIFDVIDSDGSNVIQWSEFVPVVLSAIHSIFESLDVNKNDFVSRDEYVNACHEDPRNAVLLHGSIDGTPCTDLDYGAIFDHFDRDGSGRMEYKEFVACMMTVARTEYRSGLEQVLNEARSDPSPKSPTYTAQFEAEQNRKDDEAARLKAATNRAAAEKAEAEAAEQARLLQLQRNAEHEACLAQEAQLQAQAATAGQQRIAEDTARQAAAEAQAAADAQRRAEQEMARREQEQLEELRRREAAARADADAARAAADAQRRAEQEMARREQEQLEELRRREAAARADADAARAAADAAARQEKELWRREAAAKAEAEAREKEETMRREQELLRIAAEKRITEAKSHGFTSAEAACVCVMHSAIIRNWTFSAAADANAAYDELVRHVEVLHKQLAHGTCSRYSDMYSSLLHWLTLRKTKLISEYPPKGERWVPSKELLTDLFQYCSNNTVVQLPEGVIRLCLLDK